MAIRGLLIVNVYPQFALRSCFHEILCGTTHWPYQEHKIKLGQCISIIKKENQKHEKK